MSCSVGIYEGKRIVFSTNTPFQSVVNTLRCQTHPHGKAESLSPKPPKPHSQMTKEEFTTHWASLVGESGFAYFGEFDYGDWIHLFDVGSGTRVKRFIVGNPLIAITMLEHDLNASLFVPVELLVREVNGGRGTEIRYNLPSSQILVGNSANDEELQKAVDRLDTKLEALVRKIGAEVTTVGDTIKNSTSKPDPAEISIVSLEPIQ